MPLKTSLLSALFALALAGGAQAAAATAAKAEAGTSDEVDCSREQTSTVGMRICASSDLERAEQELKATRQKLRKASDPGTRKALDALFKASDTYTDALCEGKDEIRRRRHAPRRSARHVPGRRNPAAEPGASRSAESAGRQLTPMRRARAHTPAACACWSAW